MDKAHVEHPVGFVEDKRLNQTQIDKALIAQVVETARRGNEHVCASLQRFDLWGLSHAAEDNRTAHGQVFTVLVKILADLQRQLTRWRENERTDGLVGLCDTAVQPLQNGDGEGCGLAGAGLRAADKVASFQHRADGCGLDG